MSVRSDKTSWWVIAGVLILVVAAVAAVLVSAMESKTTIRLGDGVFNTRLSLSEKERERGLSGVNHLAVNDAMLFVFDRDDKWSIWMKDMRIPIDIIWLDHDMKVVYIVKNAQPAGYPEEKFTPNDPARYVLEVAAGTVDSRNIRIGSTAELITSDQELLQ